ncbi:MAG: hypothetical protein HZA24_08375 [Nitrospirae bacterium]|nr:hypothetical protein [Nitrospirota bacterium]
MSSAEQPTIRIIHNMARAGGTVMGKCVGCMDGVAMLSEIHPAAVRMFNPLEQARDWFGLLTADELRALQGAPFADAIALIERRARERGLCLVIRDWAHLDFTGVPWVPKPAYRFALVDALAGRFQLRRAALVRHPVDQWLSVRKLDLVKGALDNRTFSLKAFLRGYAHYAEQGAQVGFFRYEDFTRQPEQVMTRLCEALALPFDAGFIDKWPAYETITGSRQTNREEGAIRPLPRQPCEPRLLAQFRANRDYRRAVRLLGYEP